MNVQTCLLKNRKPDGFRGMFTRAIDTKIGAIAYVTFFPPDFTVGSGIPPDRAVSLVGFTTDRELRRILLTAHPAPKVNIQLHLDYSGLVGSGQWLFRNWSSPEMDM